jgi:hypothetical protein
MPDDDVLSSGIGPDDTSSGSKSAFSNIDELELDLEAESSRILSVDVTPGAGKKPPTAGSDLSLAASSSDAGLSGLSSLELDDDSIITGGDSSKGGTSDIGIGETPDPGLSGISALELEDDSDVLGEGDGSDITLSSQDSGINLIAPSDSGLALDDAPIELGGSAIGSSLDLGEIGDIDDVITLEADDADDGDGDDFLLTPISEEAIEGEDESSSQVIALDDVAEEEDAAAMLGGEDDMLGADFGTGGLAAAGMPASVGVTLDDPFPAWTVVLLAGCMFVLCLCGMMMVDLVRNIWSWNEPYSLNSGLIDAILGLFS